MQTWIETATGDELTQDRSVIQTLGLATGRHACHSAMDHDTTENDSFIAIEYESVD